MVVQTRRGVVLAAAMMAVFTAAVEATIVATALPTIVGELGGFELLTWVFTAYFLAQTATIPVFGRLADVYGRKPIFFVGMGFFLVGSALCGLAQSMTALIVFRLVQGLGAGAIHPVTSTIVADIYGPTERPRVQVWITAVWGVSSVSGPAIGAFIVQHAQWPYVFWINLPVGLIAMVLLAVFLVERPERKGHDIDYLGSVLLMIGVSAVTVALTQAATLSVPAAIGLAALAVVALAAFAWQEKRAPEPILPARLWRNPLIRVGNGAALMIGAILMSVSAFIPLYVQGIMGQSSAMAGIVLGGLSLGWTVASFGAGRLMLWTTYRVPAIWAGLSLVGGSLLLILMTPNDGVVWAACGSTLVGAGLGFGNTTYLVALQSSVGWGERGVVTSSSLFARLMGQSLGAALFGAIVNLGVYRKLPEGGAGVERLMDPALRHTLPAGEANQLIAALADALHNVYLIAGLFSVISLLLAFGVPSGLSPRSHEAAARERAPAAKADEPA
jgi:EmrB/QacA subfamily drug resistance transporter